MNLNLILDIYFIILLSILFIMTLAIVIACPLTLYKILKEEKEEKNKN